MSFREILQQLSRLFRWFITVAPWEQGLRVRLGRRVKDLGPGVHVVIPFIDRLFIQSVRLRMTVVPAQTITTLDGHTVTVAGSLGFSIKDLRTLYNTLHDAEDTIILETMGLATDYIVSNRLEDCKAEQIQDHVRESLNLTRFGLGDQQFVLTDFAVVKTYRLLQGKPRDWSNSDGIDTCTEHKKNYY